MTKIKKGTREVGWVITKVHDADDQSRVGYGQVLGEAEQTEASYEAIIGRTIFVSRSLKHSDIPKGKLVRWRSFSDDGDPAFDGVVNVDWLFGEEDHAYNIDRFCMEDWGAVMVVYNAGDIRRCKPDLADYVERHPRITAGEFTKTAGIEPQSWLPIYG